MPIVLFNANNLKFFTKNTRVVETREKITSSIELIFRTGGRGGLSPIVKILATYSRNLLSQLIYKTRKKNLIANFHASKPCLFDNTKRFLVPTEKRLIGKGPFEKRP